MQIIPALEQCVRARKMIKLTLSKVRTKTQANQKCIISPIELRGEIVYKVLTRTTTQDFVKNYSAEELLPIVQAFLQEQFFYATLITTEKEIQYLQSKKGKEKLIEHFKVREKERQSHNKEKKRLIAANTPFLKDLGLSTKEGKIIATGQRKFKQINKYVELLSHLIGNDVPNITYDMGCGKGYLTFALYDFLRQQSNQPRVIGIELRDDLVTKCNTIAQKYTLSGLQFEQGSINDYKPQQADMVIALHACDIATDMAIATGVKAKARYIVVAPCCHKQIRAAMKPKQSSIQSILKHGIYIERQAEMITDTIRALLLESKGYQTKIFEFISSEHTAKNTMLTAKYTGQINTTAINEIQHLKQEFGIQSHYLEELL